ncbi:MAG: DUF4234 domain-containing protein [bacterium]|nr:DUF4234 domain-containing protein [bacterium]
MDQGHPYPRHDAIVSIGVGIILTVITCGIYGLFWNYKQMEVLNAWLGRREYDFVTWLVLSIITCGIFAVYYEYKMAKGINEVQEKNGFHVNNDLALICLLLSVFGLGIVSIAIQQADINNFYGENPDL